MRFSTLALVAWVLFVSVFAKGWAVTHTWLPWVILILGIVFAVLVILEWLGIVTAHINRPARRAAVTPAATTPPPSEPVV